MPGKSSKGSKPQIGRNAGTGRFTTVKTAKAKPATHVVERLKPSKK